MKQLLLASLLCLGFTMAYAEEATPKEGNTLKEITNTLKERITLQGYIQVGYSYDDKAKKTNSFDVNRAILMARGQITDRWSCYFMYSLAGTGKILEAYTEYRFLPGLTARLGQFKTQYTLENPISPCYTELVSCYSQAVAYLAGTNSSNPLNAANGGRDMGLLIYGDLLNSFLSYNLAVMNGQGINVKDKNNHKDIVGGLYLHPLKGLTVGVMNGQGINVKDKNNHKDIVGGLYLHPLKGLTVGGSFIQGKGNAVAVSAINPDIAIGDNYKRNRWAIGASYKSKPIDLRSEYLAGKDGHVKSNGYYCTASVHVLPKFDVVASYGHVKSNGYYCTASVHVLPKFDVVASYDYLNRNKAIGDKQTNYVAGIQYWFYPKCRLQAQYTYRNPKHGENSNLIQAQIQVRF